MEKFASIPTAYNGVNFRSRLEARWAAFFDLLEWRWEYEKEAYKLEGGLNYLPDFWLPDENRFMEIKPEEEYFSPYRLYFAGKIEKYGWRRDIIGNYYNTGLDLLEDEETNWSNSGGKSAEWKVLHSVINDIHAYVGPYFLGCDHGCSHGSNKHGNAACGEQDAKNRNAIINACKRAIECSNIVFAWVDNKTCYGTLWELGYATALGKETYIAYPEYISDLWLSILSSTKYGVFLKAHVHFWG
jgi:hypothetical protein